MLLPRRATKRTCVDDVTVSMSSSSTNPQGNKLYSCANIVSFMAAALGSKLASVASVVDIYDQSLLVERKIAKTSFGNLTVLSCKT